MIDVIYGFAITVMAISLIYTVCEGVIRAMEELDEEQRAERQREEEGEP